MRTSAPVPPAQDRASFEVRSILKLNPAAQLLLWPSFQHFKGWRFHRLSGLHSMSNHLHWEQFYPSLWAVFLALRGVHCLQPLHCCLWEQSASVPLHKSPPDPHCSVPFQAFISIPTGLIQGTPCYLSSHTGKDGLAPLCQSSSLPAYLLSNRPLWIPFLPGKYLDISNFASMREERNRSVPLFVLQWALHEDKILFVHCAGETWDKPTT